jgi:hypothetical protein
MPETQRKRASRLEPGTRVGEDVRFHLRLPPTVGARFKAEDCEASAGQSSALGLLGVFSTSDAPPETEGPQFCHREEERRSDLGSPGVKIVRRSSSQ